MKEKKGNRGVFWALAVLTAMLGCLSVGRAEAAIVTAGSLMVNLDANDFSAGEAVWANTGSLVGDFTEQGDATLTTLGPTAQQAVWLDGGNDCYIGPLTNASLDGNSDRSIEVWVYNPAPAVAEETIVAWGSRFAGNGQNMSFNYGTHEAFGAVGHWASSDIGWEQYAGGQPATDQWHHLVYSYDGQHTKVYIDGRLTNAENSIYANNGALAAVAGMPIVVGAQNNFANPKELYGSMGYATVRVHDGALTGSQILNNYNEDAARFGLALIAVAHEAGGLKHRYSFNDGTADDSINGADGTLINRTGLSTIAGGRVDFGNNDTQTSNGTNGDYVDLPDGIVSSLGNNATIEFWYQWDGGGNWQRVFDFGTSNGGEGTSPDAPDNAYLMYTPNPGGMDNYGRFGFRRGRTATAGAEERVANTAAPIADPTGPQHVAISWDGSSGVAKMYLNGVLTGRQAIHFNLEGMPDVNNWLGRAQWNDQLYDGSIDEFRFYDQALTAGQIAVNHAAGADTVVAAYESPAAALAHRYTFNGHVTDVVGDADGTLINASGSAQYAGGQLVLGNTGQASNSGTGDYVDLPNGLISSLGNDATIEIWTAWSGTGGGWQRIFDLGNSDGGEDNPTVGDNQNYLFVTPNANGSDHRLGYQQVNPRVERVITSPGVMGTNVPKHLVVVVKGTEGVMEFYEDGSLVGSGPLHFSLAELNDVNNWLGRSQFGGDALYTGSYDDLRIYTGAMTGDQIAASFLAGPNVLVVPEPGTVALLLIGLAGLALAAARRR